MNAVPEIHQGSYGRVFVLNLEVSLREHAHSDSHLIFVVDGDVNDIVSVSGFDYKLNKSQAIAVNKFEPHAHKKLSEKASKCLVFYLDQDWMNDLGVFSDERPAFKSASFPVIKNFALFLNEFAEYLEADPMGIDIEAYVLKTVSISIQAMSLEQPCESVEYEHNGEVDYRLKKSIAYMKSHLGSRFKIDEVAKAAGLSRPHLFNLFRKHLRLTPGVFWNTLRIETAIEKLLNDELALHELSSELGFSEPGNFSRFFRNHTGFRPSDYRSATDYLYEMDSD